uniref:Uncharacterized protein n=1 Tax=Oryza sativa subsp. japonica TaxID=39947 RepID=Q6YVR3_ORYSJ|nr:hypothetical protein [Oryza sativa Japonica Group]
MAPMSASACALRLALPCEVVIAVDVVAGWAKAAVEGAPGAWDDKIASGAEGGRADGNTSGSAALASPSRSRRLRSLFGYHLAFAATFLSLSNSLLGDLLRWHQWFRSELPTGIVK